MKHYLWMILFIFSLLIENVSAQSSGKCGSKFEEINKKCIRGNYISYLVEKESELAKKEVDKTYTTKYKRTMIVLKKPFDQIEGNTYFLRHQPEESVSLLFVLL
jgi:hypothetical protein